MIEYDYAPDNWVIVKITGTDPHYRVFGAWRGGYTNGDAWRLNSGITAVKEDDEYYYLNGFSGSVYRCHKKTYGWLGSYCSGIITNYCEASQGTMSIVADMPDLMKMDWLI